MKVIAFLNSFIQGSSGGDVRFIEVMKRLEEKGDINLTVLTSKLGKDFCTENGLNAVFRLTTQENKAGNVIVKYAQRIFSALLIDLGVEDGSCLYSSSDFLPDVLPAFIWKLRNKKAKWFVCVFLLVPNLFRDYNKSFAKNNKLSFPTFRRFFYFLSQQFSIFWGKRWADQILVLNKMDKEYLVKNRGIAESRISLVNGGVDYNHLKSLISKKATYDGIFLGRFHYQKGIFDLIQIWKLVCDKKPEARLCIIGSGSPLFVEKVKEFIKESNLCEKIELVGSKFADEKFLLLKSGRIFLCPSYYESFAIVIAEAMACGLPVVAYDLPIYNNIYRGHISKVPLGDFNKFADTVLNFLNNNNLRTTFGEDGQKFIQRYNWEKIAKTEYRILTEKYV